MSDRCDKHQLTRCVICESMARRGQSPVSAPVSAPPSSISGGPPPDIEGLGNVRDREPKTIEEANTDYDKILAEVEALSEKASEYVGRDLTIQQVREKLAGGGGVRLLLRLARAGRQL